jgi:hypothetical protein
MIVFHPVNVIYLNSQRSSQPLGDPAFLAAVFEDPGAEQPDLHVIPASAANQQFLEWHPKRACLHFAPLPRFVPAHGIEPESLSALAIGVALVIIGLDVRPIILPSTIREERGLGSELAAFYGLNPRRVGEAKSLLTCHEAVAEIVILLDCPPIVNFSHTPIIANMRSYVVSRMLRLAENGANRKTCGASNVRFAHHFLKGVVVAGYRARWR